MELEIVYDDDNNLIKVLITIGDHWSSLELEIEDEDNNNLIKIVDKDKNNLIQ